jgi:hypothetical protein
MPAKTKTTEKENLARHILDNFQLIKSKKQEDFALHKGEAVIVIAARPHGKLTEMGLISSINLPVVEMMVFLAALKRHIAEVEAELAKHVQTCDCEGCIEQSGR